MVRFTCTGRIVAYDPLKGSGLVCDHRNTVYSFSQSILDPASKDSVIKPGEEVIFSFAKPASKLVQSGTRQDKPEALAIILLKDAPQGTGRVVHVKPAYGLLEGVLNDETGSNKPAKVFFAGSLLHREGLAIHCLTELLRVGDRLCFSALYAPEKDGHIAAHIRCPYTAGRIDFLSKFSLTSPAWLGFVSGYSSGGVLSTWVNGIGAVFVPRQVLQDCGYGGSLERGSRVKINIKQVAVPGDAPRNVNHNNPEVTSIEKVGNTDGGFLLGGPDEGRLFGEGQSLNPISAAVQRWKEIFQRPEALKVPRGFESFRALDDPSSEDLPNIVKWQGYGIIGPLAQTRGYVWTPQCGLVFFILSDCEGVQACIYERFNTLQIVYIEAERQRQFYRSTCSWRATRVMLVTGASIASSLRNHLVRTMGRMEGSGDRRVSFLATQNHGSVWFTSASYPFKVTKSEGGLAQGDIVPIVAYPDVHVSVPSARYRVLCFPALQDWMYRRWKRSLLDLKLQRPLVSHANNDSNTLVKPEESSASHLKVPAEEGSTENGSTTKCDEKELKISSCWGEEKDNCFTGCSTQNLIDELSQQQSSGTSSETNFKLNDMASARGRDDMNVQIGKGLVEPVSLRQQHDNASSSTISVANVAPKTSLKYSSTQGTLLKETLTNARTSEPASRDRKLNMAGESSGFGLSFIYHEGPKDGASTEATKRLRESHHRTQAYECLPQSMSRTCIVEGAGKAVPGSPCVQDGVDIIYGAPRSSSANETVNAIGGLSHSGSCVTAKPEPGHWMSHGQHEDSQSTNANRAAAAVDVIQWLEELSDSEESLGDCDSRYDTWAVAPFVEDGDMKKFECQQQAKSSSVHHSAHSGNIEARIAQNSNLCLNPSSLVAHSVSVVKNSFTEFATRSNCSPLEESFVNGKRCDRVGETLQEALAQNCPPIDHNSPNYLPPQLTSPTKAYSFPGISTDSTANVSHADTSGTGGTNDATAPPTNATADLMAAKVLLKSLLDDEDIWKIAFERYPCEIGRLANLGLI